MTVLRIDDLEIDLVRRTTTLSGVDLGLTPLEQSLLYVLATHAGQVLSRDALLDALWKPGYAPGSNVIDRHIRNLRAKLHDNWRRPRFIATVAGRGYRFVADDPQDGSISENGAVASGASLRVMPVWVDDPVGPRFMRARCDET